MVSDRFLVRCFLILSVFSNASLWAVVYGSETAVSILPAVTFPSADNDNTMLYFGGFKNGFTLEDSLTTCTFKSIYPVAGTLALNGGSLYLSEDFIITNTASIVGGGRIIGNSRMMELCSSFTSLASTYTFKDITLALGSNLEVVGKLVFEGNCYLAGRLYHFDLSGGSLVVAPGSQLIFDDVYLDTVQDHNIACADDSARIILHDTQWNQSADFVFDTGSIEFSHNVDFLGSYTFWYDSSQTSTIDSGARWLITNDMTLKVGRKKAVDYVEPFYFVDETSIIKLDNCSLLVTSSGMGLSKGKFELDRDVSVDVLSSSTMNGLIIGTGQEGGDFSMKLNSGAAISLLAGWWVYNNTHATGRLHALSQASRCTRYADSQFCVQKDWTIPPMIFQVASGMPVSILEPGVNFRYDKTDLITPMGKLNITGGDKAPGFLLTGNDSIYLNDGVEPLPIYVSGMGNKLHGSGSVSAPIILQDAGTDLCCQLNGMVNEDITMNGGTLILTGDLDLGLDVILTGSGKVDLSRQSFNFGIRTGFWDSSIEWDGDVGIIHLNSDTNLVGTWTFKNNCILDGGQNALDLTGGGKLFVDAGSHLVLQDITIKGITAQAIGCADDDASIELHNVIWEQVENFTFNTGSMKFFDENIFQGSYCFAYDSQQTATIDAHSRVAISDGMSLVIGRKKAIDYVEPLYFVDNTSALQLNNCSYIITGTGMRLTNGRIEVCGDVNFSTLGTASAQGLELGDGVDGHDVVYRFDAGGSLKFKKGWLVYNCFSPHAFVASSENASVIRYADTGLLLKRPWTFPRMELRIDSGSPITISDGGVVTYNNSHLTLSTVELDILGELVGSIQFRLSGGQSLYMTKGVFPAYLYINGTGNLLYGNGDVSGPIIFQHPTAELTCNLIGTLFFSPILNGGKLILKNDLQFGPNVTVTTGGQIDLSYYRMALSSNKCSWTQGIAWQGTGGAINLRADVDLLATWSFTNNCVLDGRGSVLELKSGGNLAVQDNSTLTIKNTLIKGVSGSNIRCLTDNAHLVLDNVTFEYNDDFLFSAGSIKTANDVDFRGTFSFVYDSICTSTISAGSKWSMIEGLVFDVGRKNGNEPLYFESKDTSVLNFHDSSLSVNFLGMNLKGGRVTIDGDVTLSSCSTSSEVGLMLGTGNPEDDFNLVLNSGASIKFLSGWLIYNNVLPDRFFATSKNARIVRYAGSKTYIKNDWLFPQMTLAVDSGQPVTIIGEGKTLTYNNVRLDFGFVDFDFSGNQLGDSFFALTGHDLLFLTKGSFPCYLAVSGQDNKLRGTGDITGPVVFADAASELVCDFNGSMMHDVALNGGTIILVNDFYLGPQNTLAQTGTIDLGGHRCVFGTEDQAWTSTLVWKKGSMSLNSHIMLQGVWTFQNDCVVYGGGNMLDLDGVGSIVVADGATVTFRNVRIRGISGDQIRCLGDSSTLILDDVIWEQDGDVTFAQGKIQWSHDVTMKGQATFVYQSGHVSTIAYESNLILDQGLTFSYDPIAIPSKELIAFEDSSSSLVLNSATLCATVTGLMLKNGKLQIKGDSYLSVEQVIEDDTVLIDEGICLGDGDGAHDIFCEIVSGASLHVTQGSFIYNNYSPNFLNMMNGGSGIFVHAGARLSIQESLDLGVGTLYLSKQAKVDVVPGKELLGSVFITE